MGVFWVQVYLTSSAAADENARSEGQPVERVRRVVLLVLRNTPAGAGISANHAASCLSLGASDSGRWPVESRRCHLGASPTVISRKI